MADEKETGAHSVPPDLPASPNVETREQTIARVVDEVEAVGAALGGSSDPSTRRGVQRTLVRTIIRAGAIGAVVGAITGVVLSQLPGPRDEGRGLGIEGGGAWHVFSYALVLAIGVAIIFGVIYGALWTRGAASSARSRRRPAAAPRAPGERALRGPI